MSLHSNVSASACERWWNCPGSVQLCETVPARTSTYAAEGTVAHNLWEPLFAGKVKPAELYKRVGEVIKTKEGIEVTVDDEMVDSAIEYYEFVMSVKKEMDAQNGKHTELFFEHRVVLKSVDEHAFGTTDTALVKKGRSLKVIDYKYGKGHAVEIEGNKQMMYYAVGMMDAVDCRAFDDVELIVVQPRCRHADGKIRRWTTTVKDVLAFAEELKGRIADTRVKGARFNSGPWCYFCNAKSVCPAQFAAVQERAGADFSVIAPETPRLKDISSLTDEQLVVAYSWQKAVNSWFEDIEARLKERLEAGEQIAGIKLVDGRKGNRAWKSEEEVVRTFSPLVGEDALYDKRLLSPAKLEKKLGKKAVEGLTFQPDGKKTLAFDSDPRPIAKTSAQDDFGVVTWLGDNDKPKGSDDKPKGGDPLGSLV